VFFFFQAEDGIRALVRSRGLGDVYKRQVAGDAAHYERLSAIDSLEGIVLRNVDGAKEMSDGEKASLMELVLEGLHQNSLLSRDDGDAGERVFGDMLAQMARSLGR